MVGDGDAMGVAGQIVQYVFRPAKGRLGVDDPVLAKQGAQEGGERLLVRQRQTFSEESQLFAAKGASQSGHELAAKDTAEHFHRQEEVGSVTRSSEA